ncbi:hypothetical protein VT06_01000 [Arsukibacterium sp. MJ3]|uniref:DsrH/TusB family sulfur metabolism protein n=1 Tax=Arsukibacterium sp. MJ3 TaxID=1632859 RepID=UPI000626FBA4|nr:DsrH/TusB family sulfur metabolism protein [Arsukibacterium sp. MJ3]KKO50584.1 hypothetical protein VT06_01000 [Arsukibacterium sp. MJ3]
MKLITLISPAIILPELAEICQLDDIILLRQDAVYLAQQSDINWPCRKVVALHSDVNLRHVSATAGITIIDDDNWVQLVATASQVLLWR